MQYPNYDGQWQNSRQKPLVPTKEKRFSGLLVTCLVIVLLIASVLLTYTLTAKQERDYYNQKLAQQQKVIAELQKVLQMGEGTTFQKLEFLSALVNHYSYYADSIDQDAAIEAVLKAYVAATGDQYAAYYTDEEYAAMLQDSSGSSYGIGVSIANSTCTVEGVLYEGFEVLTVFKNSPASKTELRPGDFLYAVKMDGEWKTVSQLGGYSAGLDAMKGENGSVVEFAIFRREGETFVTKELSVTRGPYVKESVSYRLSEADATVGIVQISEFDFTTPKQFKEAVKDLLSKGALRFVFDVRNNPGGDLQSIKGVLSFLLEEGDLILASVDSDGTRVHSYYAEATSFTGMYADCSVAKDEVGMFKDLDMVVLCNENTASAAEVFTASLRDHKQIPIIGKNTFGKGIMQSYIGLASQSMGLYGGYIKITTYAYVTECGIPYHGIGIAPTVEVSLSEEAKKYNFYALPESLDDQLLSAIASVKQ